MDAVIAKDVAKSYFSKAGQLPVLKKVDFVLERGSSLSVIGESGTGKSTLLNLVGGLDYLTGGSLSVFGTRIEPLDETSLALFRNKHVGFVFQNHHLLPDFTALENVMIPALVKGTAREEARQQAMTLLGRIGLRDRVEHKPARLSGGEQQRVAIARALVNRPDLVLLDEPTGNLDEKSGERVVELLWEMKEEYALTVLLVTHNHAIAKQTDKCLCLSGGQAAYVTL